MNSNEANNLMEKIVSLAKRRGFIYQNSEIYGGLASSYDYGPLGVELKNNIKSIWWKMFVSDRQDIVGIDGNILLSPRVWEASGHVEKFKDPLVECKKCHHRFRPDKLKNRKRCPDCGGSFTKEKFFSGMFSTVIGPVEKEGLKTYLRPETAQSIFVNFKNILDSTNIKIPFGIAQIGKAFRNEITSGNFIFRTYEFEQMEIEYFINPKADWEKIFNSFVSEMYSFAESVGINTKKLFNNDIPDGERAHYSKKTFDIEYKYPFGQDELWGLAYRTDYDLKQHIKFSKKDLTYFDEDTKERYIPHVIEPSLGVDRTLLAVLLDAYNEEEINGEKRVVLKLKPKMAPYKVAIFPLLKNKKEITKKAQDVYMNLRSEFPTFWDDRGNIGKRYRYQDEIGTPLCVTVDFETLENNTVTLRDRDTMKQARVNLENLTSEINNFLNKN